MTSHISIVSRFSEAQFEMSVLLEVLNFFLVLKLPLFRISQQNSSLLWHKIYACASVSERVVVSPFAVKNCMFCIFYKSSLLWCRKNGSTATIATGLSCTRLNFLSLLEMLLCEDARFV